MKKYYLFIVVSLVVLATGCNQKEIARLQAQRDSLMAVTGSKDASLVEFVNAFNEIQANLDTIKQKEMIIDNRAKGGEVQANQKEQIQSDINYIYSLLQKNRELVSKLTDKLKKSEHKSAELQKMIDNLNNIIVEKDAQIEQLTAELNKLNIQVNDLTGQVGNLTTENAQKQAEIEAKTTQLNTAYYIIGTVKELKEKNIITKEGGFVGIGRSKDISDEVDLSYFTKVDITKLNTIPIMKKKVEIISKHPAGRNLSEEKREIAAYVSKALSFVRKMQRFLATPQVPLLIS